MQRWTGALIVALALVVPSASAEERKSEEKAAAPPAERRQIRVLQDPKDISSFYRSSESNGAAHSAGPYGLASYYRSTAQNPRVYLWRTTGYEASLYYGTRGAYRRR